MQPEKPVLYGVNVGVENGKIVFVDEREFAKNTRIIDGTDKVLIPGLYNCHTHVAMTLLRGCGADLALEDWLFKHIFPAEKKLTPELIRLGTTLAIAEMIASGTTAFTDMYFNVDVVAEVVDKAGVKANLSNAVISLGQDNYDFQKDPVREQTLRVLCDYHQRDDGRIKAEVAIHGVYTSDEKTWRQVLEFAQERNLGLQLHLAETKTEQENCVAKYRLTPTQVFLKNGVFDLPVTAAHCVWVTDEDIEILTDKNISVAHNPISNLKLASGLAPVSKMLAKNINVALGTDGMASNNSHDLFEEIKMASLLQKYAGSDPTVLPALEVLKMATVNGARAQRREREGGMIAEGHDADLVLLDFHSPRQTICHDLISNLAYSTTGRDVAMTLCQGKILYENGEYKTIDIEKVLAEAKKAARIFTQ